MKRNGVFDNLATMSREFWHDGRLVASVSARLVETKSFIPPRGAEDLYVAGMANGPSFGKLPNIEAPHEE